MSQADDQATAKARSFFEKAGKVAETDNFDYAIDMYLQGLRHAPDALMEGHLPLCELALQRQGKSGKKPSMVDKVKHMGGKTPLDQMLNAEYLFVKDPERWLREDCRLDCQSDISDCQRHTKTLRTDIYSVEGVLYVSGPIRQGHSCSATCFETQTERQGLGR